MKDDELKRLLVRPARRWSDDVGDRCKLSSLPATVRVAADSDEPTLSTKSLHSTARSLIIMAAHGQAVIFCSCRFFFFFLLLLRLLLLPLLFLTYSQRSHIRCLPQFRTYFRLSVNLECRSEMCCTRLAQCTAARVF